MPCGGVVSGGSPGEFLANSEWIGGGFREEGGWIWGRIMGLVSRFSESDSVSPTTGNFHGPSLWPSGPRCAATEFLDSWVAARL